MSDHRNTTATGGGLIAALLVMVLLCGGIVTLIVGGGYLYSQRQAARDRELRAAMLSQIVERALPPGAHAIAIGPDGELFLDDQPVDLATLQERLNSLAPQEKRGSTEIYIRPGLLAPADVVSQVEELTGEFDQTIEPLPGASMQIAPEGEESSDPKK